MGREYTDNKNIKLKIILMIISLIIVLTGCTKSLDDRSEIKETKTVIDCIGREVVVPKNPQRVAILYAYTGHVATLLGEEDNIVGLVEGLKRDVLMQRKIENINNISVPYNSGIINIEELIKIQPDVAFVRMSTVQNEGEVEKLNKANIPFVVVDYTNIEEQKKSIRVMGEVLNKKEEAEKYLKFYEDILNLVKERTSILNDDEKIRVYHSINEAVRTDSKGSIGDEITSIAGLINVSTDEELNISEGSAYCTLEQIYKWKPEAIIVNEVSVKEYMYTDSKWTGLGAVENKTVYNLPVGISRWAHPGSLETPIATLYIANLFYPELFEEIDISKITKDYYRDFFGLELSVKDIEAILSGEGMRLEKDN